MGVLIQPGRRRTDSHHIQQFDAAFAGLAVIEPAV